MKQILVLGGGAAGMAAAIAAAEQAPKGVRVVLVEGNARVGKKLLATGNGRCNLSNGDIRPEWYFTADRPALAAMLQAIQTKAEPVAWFAAHGLLCRAPDEAGRIYPYANQAADVLNLLLDWLARTGVQVRCDSRVKDLYYKGKSYTVVLESGEKLTGDAVICAMGGAAGPQFGTDGFGSRLAAACGCRILPEYPCLVPLKCEKQQVAGLAGIRAKGEVSLYDGDKLLRREAGEVQFTDYGISGIAVMQLSGLLRPKGGPKAPEIRLNLFPHMDGQALAAYLAQRARALPSVTMADYMTGLVHRRIGLAVYKACGLGAENRPAAGLSDAEWAALAAGFQAWRFTGLEHTGWKNAQTTGGGMALGQLQPDTFGLKGCPGIYFVGETLDCAGSCGGFNLHWAFGSGILAGRAAAKFVR